MRDENSSVNPEPVYIPPAKVKYDPVARDREDPGYPQPDLPVKGRCECYSCHQLLAYDEFTSLTDPLCTKCRINVPAKELAEIKERMCQKFSQQLINAADEREPLEHIESILAELMYNFGGMRVFVKCWSEQVKAAFDKSPGSRLNLDHCRAIAKLVMDCNKLQHAEDVLDLSDEQLRVKKELALMSMLSQATGDPHRRQLLIELLRSGGMQLSEVPGLPQYTEAN